MLIDRTNIYWWVAAMPPCSRMTIHYCCLGQATRFRQREFLTNLCDSLLPHWVGTGLLVHAPMSAWSAFWLQVSVGHGWAGAQSHLLGPRKKCFSSTSPSTGSLLLSSLLKLAKLPSLLGRFPFWLPDWHVSFPLVSHAFSSAGVGELQMKPFTLFGNREGTLCLQHVLPV